MSLRYRICPDCGSLHDVSDWPGNHRFWNEVLCAPSVVRDGLDDLWHPMDNGHYDSKRQFAKVTRDLGGIEVGTEVQEDKRVMNEVTEADVATAYKMVEQGYKAAPAAEASVSDMQSVIA